MAAIVCSVKGQYSNCVTDNYQCKTKKVQLSPFTDKAGLSLHITHFLVPSHAPSFHTPYLFKEDSLKHSPVTLGLDEPSYCLET